MKKWEQLNSDPNLENRVLRYVETRDNRESRTRRIFLSAAFSFFLVLGYATLNFYQEEVLEATGHELLSEFGWDVWEVALSD